MATAAPPPAMPRAASPSDLPDDHGSDRPTQYGRSTTPTADEPAILLYYCYTAEPLPSVPSHVSFQRDLCASLDLRGRIRVSSEGINGVLSALRRSALEEYVRRVVEELGDGATTEEEFDAKYCRLRADLGVEEQMFDGLSVKATREVVSLWEPGAEEQRSAARAKAKERRRRRRADEKQSAKGGGGENGGDAANGAAASDGRSSSAVPSPPNGVDLDGYGPAPRLSPEEWNESLLSRKKEGAVLVDARNVYESRVGHFRVPGVPTLLTNTRKYSSLPAVLEAHKSQLAGRHVYMYCTGGVRCERASAFLLALTDGDRWSEGEGGQMEKPKGIYQLKGGVQRYLEKFGHAEGVEDDESDRLDPHRKPEGDEKCLYRGKNFVFDPRRTDPMVGGLQPVGQCLLCEKPWDDYDNGAAPCDNRETRCRRCRILVLTCDGCRGKVRAWGDDDVNNNNGENLPELFCGPGGKSCVDQGNSADAVEILTG